MARQKTIGEIQTIKCSVKVTREQKDKLKKFADFCQDHRKEKLYYFSYQDVLRTLIDLLPENKFPSTTVDTPEELKESIQEILKESFFIAF